MVLVAFSMRFALIFFASALFLKATKQLLQCLIKQHIMLRSHVVQGCITSCSTMHAAACVMMVPMPSLMRIDAMNDQ